MNYATLLNLINTHGYIALFVFDFVQEIGVPLPVPTEIILLFAGFHVYSHALSLWHVLVVAILADFCGSLVMFILCRYLGEFVLKFMSKHVKGEPGKYLRISRLIEKHGVPIILIGRFMPFARFYVTVSAGFLELPFKVYLPASLLASTLWVSTLVLLGVFFGKQILHVITYIDGIKHISLIVSLVIIAILAFFVYNTFIKDTSKK